MSTIVSHCVKFKFCQEMRAKITDGGKSKAESRRIERYIYISLLHIKNAVRDVSCINNPFLNITTTEKDGRKENRRRGKRKREKPRKEALLVKQSERRELKSRSCQSLLP